MKALLEPLEEALVLRVEGDWPPHTHLVEEALSWEAMEDRGKEKNLSSHWPNWRELLWRLGALRARRGGLMALCG
jgi:hypothetical protein